MNQRDDSIYHPRIMILQHKTVLCWVYTIICGKFIKILSSSFIYFYSGTIKGIGNFTIIEKHVIIKALLTEC